MVERHKPRDCGESSREVEITGEAETVRNAEIAKEAETAVNVVSASENSVLEEEELVVSNCNSYPSIELSCNLCDHESETEGGLKIHMGRLHKDIPLLDGGNDGSESEQVSELEIVKESLD